MQFSTRAASKQVAATGDAATHVILDHPSIVPRLPRFPVTTFFSRLLKRTLVVQVRDAKYSLGNLWDGSTSSSYSTHEHQQAKKALSDRPSQGPSLTVWKRSLVSSCATPRSQAPFPSNSRRSPLHPPQPHHMSGQNLIC